MATEPETTSVSWHARALQIRIDGAAGADHIIVVMHAVMPDVDAMTRR
jgi:hypothetical protein